MKPKRKDYDVPFKGLPVLKAVIAVLLICLLFLVIQWFRR